MVFKTGWKFFAWEILMFIAVGLVAEGMCLLSPIIGTAFSAIIAAPVIIAIVYFSLLLKTGCLKR